MSLKEPRKVSWQIDASDRIIGLCDNFPRFASENQNFHFAKSVIGVPLQEVVDCQQTSHLYRILLSRVRYHNQTLELPLRVDGPDSRRWMKMKIRRLAGSENVQFESQTVRQEPREPLGVFQSDRKRSDDTVEMCSWCNKLKTEAGWLDAEEACKELGLEDTELVPKLVNSLCKECQLQAISSTLTSP